MVIWHVKQTGKVKELDKWVSCELTANQKNHLEVLSSLIVCNNKEPFLHRFMTCDEKWILYNNQWWQAQWLDQEETPKHFRKLNLHPKTAHGHCLVVSCRSDPLQLSESQWNHYIWEICSAHQWEALKTVTSAASIGQQKGPNPWQCPAAHNQYFKSWMNWATKFCLICYMHLISGQLTTTSSSNSTIFCRENASTTSRTHKIFSKSSLSLEAWIIFATEINKLISCWQKCVDCNGSCSD